MRTIRYQIEAEDDGRRVDDFLIRKHGVSRRVITTLKKLPDGLLRCGEHIRTVDLLHTGDVLEINLPEQPKRIPLCDISVPILYEDEDVIVFNKPADMPVHQSGGHIFNTLDGVYAAHCAKTGEVAPLRAINRLDKDTTGIVVAAKNQIAAGKLWKAVTNQYVAVVEGIPSPADGTVDLPIEREIPMELKRIVTPEGQRSVTHYRTVAPGEDAALLEFVLETGRT
ncbi:MAG: pseudouridine synthase, partial [Angelakisella sp.]